MFSSWKLQDWVLRANQELKGQNSATDRKRKCSAGLTSSINIKNSYKRRSYKMLWTFFYYDSKNLSICDESDREKDRQFSQLIVPKLHVNLYTYHMWNCFWLWGKFIFCKNSIISISSPHCRRMKSTKHFLPNSEWPYRIANSCNLTTNITAYYQWKKWFIQWTAIARTNLKSIKFKCLATPYSYEKTDFRIKIK